jgi:hypothetical protein
MLPNAENPPASTSKHTRDAMVAVAVARDFALPILAVFCWHAAVPWAAVPDDGKRSRGDREAIGGDANQRFGRRGG